MKKVMWFLAGFVGATLAYFILVYLAGITAEKLGMVFYDSESDQQRNFNIVFSLWLIFGAIAGFLVSSKKS